MHSPRICYVTQGITCHQTCISVTIYVVNKDRLFSSMAKKQGDICQLVVYLFYDSVGSTDSNQVLWYNWLFSCFMILFPSSSICFRRVTDLNLWDSCPLVLSEGHSEIFWVWQYHWLFRLVLCRMMWDWPLPAPCMCCSSKHLVVSMGFIYW